MSSEMGRTKQAASWASGVPAPVKVGELGRNRRLAIRLQNDAATCSGSCPHCPSWRATCLATRHSISSGVSTGLPSDPLRRNRSERTLYEFSERTMPPTLVGMGGLWTWVTIKPPGQSVRELRRGPAALLGRGRRPLDTNPKAAGPSPLPPSYKRCAVAFPARAPRSVRSCREGTGTQSARATSTLSFPPQSPRSPVELPALSCRPPLPNSTCRF
jgi:hypothetical protein